MIDKSPPEKYPFHYDMPKVAPKNSAEITIQASIIKRVESQFQAAVVAVPNGTFIKSFAGRKKANTEGRTKGFPDLVILGFGRNERKTAFAEIKASTSLKKEQKDWLTKLHDNGHQCGVFRSQDTITDWLQQRGWK